MRTSRAERRYLAAENRKQSAVLSRVPEEQIPRENSPIPRERQPVEVWRSQEFLVQVFNAGGGIERLSVIRSRHDGENWGQDISWEDLQRLKSECGRGERDAVEIFPRDGDVVNVANMRHLWVLPGPLPFAWRTKWQAG